MNTSALSEKYQKKTDKEHILDNPDTYIGAVETVDHDTYIYNENTETIVSKTLQYVPGLYKMFDEALVNCRDHYIRTVQDTKSCKPNSIPLSTINITIDDEGVISMFNDGNGIDIEKHPQYNIWIPELIFAHLRTSTNYNKDEKKIVGGKNGLGIKLVFIWSVWGSIETVDHIRQLKYVQEFNNNLDTIKKPVITKFRKDPYTKISFKPDYKRLGIKQLTPDIISLFKRRVYDIAGVTSKNIKVRYNSQLIPIKTFQHYVNLYIGPKNITKQFYETPNDRWEYVVCLAPSDEFTQISFVNGIFTGGGGKHVDYIINQITKKLITYIKQKKKVDVKAASIREQLMIFLRCDIVNPAFNSQTKDYMNTPVSKFGSTCTVSPSFIEKIAKMGVMEVACNITEIKNNKNAKKTDGQQIKNIRGIPKLVDANRAGTTESHSCTIIFCEGDSAKAGIISGLSREDRDFIGVYAMKGKIFNSRGETAHRISENKEISEIKKLLGLEVGQEYTEENIKEKLRYGNILLMTDQDLDGSHIKGLVLNLFDSEWPSLVVIPNFIGFMNTPILKARKGLQELSFYNEGEYEQWKLSTNTHGWKIKYFKGLGTSTSKEFKKYFANKKVVMFSGANSEDNQSLDMAFNKKRANDRKSWLSTYNRNLYLDTNKSNVSFAEFVDRELIHFSKYDCDRSIPNGVDGLKISQRKILFSAFKKNLRTEIKVAQFSGYVSEHSCYHHGEASLNGAIVGMAQNYVGSNNINLLEPNGQFGSRLQGGKDSASERYICTKLNELARFIYPSADDNILRYLDDDGTPVEPIHYIPIIPMVLINGGKGIGTGFSTDIMCYNPLKIIDYYQCLSLGNECDIETITPYYEGFKGHIIRISPTKYLIKATYDIVSSKQVRITELPVGVWTDDYKQYLESLMDSKKKQTLVRDYNDMSTDSVVDITVTFSPNVIQDLVMRATEHGCNALEKLLKLYTTQTTTNMHMFDGNEKLKKYNTIEGIIDDHVSVRLEAYRQRKAMQMKSLTIQLQKVTDKARFIQEILDDVIDLRKKNQVAIAEMLKTRKFHVIDEDPSYRYLVKMPMDSVTREVMDKLLLERNECSKALTQLQATTIEHMWWQELETLRMEYTKNQVKPKKRKKLKIK